MRRHLSYRCRRRLKRATLALLILGVVTAGVLLISFLYLERFVVYTEEGVILRRGDAAAAEENAPEPEPLPEVEIRTVYGGAKRPVREEETEAAEPEEFVPLQGYVVYYEDLKDPDTVLEKIQSDPDCTVVMLEVALGSGKSCFSGTFSGAGIAEELDAEATDALLRQLTGQYYLIAMLPAYQNTAYALANQSEGLMITGGALWVDWDGCYWMDPASEVSQKHLMDLCSELTEMGFDEVVFSNFYFPSSSNIVYNRETPGYAAVQKAGALLSNSAGLLGMNVGYCDLSRYISMIAPGGNGHLIFTETEGSNVSGILSWMASGDEADSEPSIEAVGSGEASPEQTVIFCTDSHDTRFDGYSILRSLSE